MTDDRVPEIGDETRDSGTDRRSPAEPDRASMFASLRIPNYRLFYAGMAVSMTGSWMQATAQAWLVLTLSGSASVLGLIVALQALPVLLIGP